MYRLTHIAAAISHGSGGVGSAVIALAEKQRAMGEAIRILCLGEQSEEFTRSKCEVEVVRLPRRRPAAFGFSPQLIGAILRWQPAVVHSHGLWMYPGLAAHIAATTARIPLIISPHGMLDAWALKKSGWRKKIAGWLYENGNLRSAACIHALCESEYQNIRAYGLKNPVCVIPNGVNLPELPARQGVAPWDSHIRAYKNVMLFLGRIHPKKGLEKLIRAWSVLKRGKVKESELWHLVIAGWSQGGHEQKLKQLVYELNLSADVSFTGPLYHTAKDTALRAAKAFILPSFSEGLPMAVLEAWAYGLPVIMTSQCNLPEGFEAGAALDVRPEAVSIAEGLKSFLGLSEGTREQMGRSGFELVRSRFSWPKIAAQMVDVYEWVLGQGDKPGCVKL